MSEHPDSRAAMELYEREVWPLVMRAEREQRRTDWVLIGATYGLTIACIWIAITADYLLSRAIVCGFIFALGFLGGQTVFLRRFRVRAFTSMRHAHEEAVFRLAMDDGDD